MANVLLMVVATVVKVYPRYEVVNPYIMVFLKYLGFFSITTEKATTAIFKDIFSNSFKIIHEASAKKISTVENVWKSEEKITYLRNTFKHS